ncbi:MAG: hypothetical protein IJ966_04490 [Bacilli bacterium]|nr:hypothetical protein [Bacilli bacterium]
MTQEIYQKISMLFNEYTLQDRSIDEEFYQKFFDIIKDKHKLKKLVIINSETMHDRKNKKYTNMLNLLFGMAAFEVKEGNLIIYSDNMEKTFIPACKSVDLNDTDKNILYNLMILQVLLHEYEHVIQKEKMEKSNDYESELLKALKSKKPQTTESYKYCLKERLAQVHSLSTILSLIADNKIMNPAIDEYFRSSIEEELSSGYEYVDERGFLKEKGEGIFMNPTQRYAMLMKCNVEEVKRLDLMANDLDSRLLYGLEVSEEDYMSRFGEKGLKY